MELCSIPHRQGRRRRERKVHQHQPPSYTRPAQRSERLPCQELRLHHRTLAGLRTLGSRMAHHGTRGLEHQRRQQAQRPLHQVRPQEFQRCQLQPHHRRKPEQQHLQRLQQHLRQRLVLRHELPLQPLLQQLRLHQCGRRVEQPSDQARAEHPACHLLLPGPAPQHRVRRPAHHRGGDERRTGTLSHMGTHRRRLHAGQPLADQDPRRDR